jgi:mannose/fructose-specific phosphotransferase system component IIA
VENLFLRLWPVLVLVILVPVLVVMLKPQEHEYRSKAVVWVSAPVGDAQPALGNNNPFITPAQNQAQVINDLLSTEAFRSEVVLLSQIAGASPSADATRRAAQELRVGAAASGVNLLTITALSEKAENAQWIVSAVVDRYVSRATSEIQRKAEVSNAYYQQQLPIAQQALDQTRSDLAAYLRANPKAADPLNVASQDGSYRTLISQVDTQSKVVSGIESALQSVQLREASAPQSQQASFQVQDAARKPESPLPISITKRLGVPFAGFLFGLLIGGSYLYFAYRTDHTIRSSTDLDGIGVPLLGYVPVLQSMPLWIRLTPARWIVGWRRRDFARRAATSISGTISFTSRPAEETS